VYEWFIRFCRKKPSVDEEMLELLKLVSSVVHRRQTDWEDLQIRIKNIEALLKEDQ